MLNRLIFLGSVWRLHRHWFDTTALPDLFGVGARIAQNDTLCRGPDCLLEYKGALYAHLRERWADLIDADLKFLSYYLTRTYLEDYLTDSQVHAHALARAVTATVIACNSSSPWRSRLKVCRRPTRK